jgi:excinuclease ABC subunit C
LLYVRQGRILDSKSFFPKQTGGDKLAGVLRAFIVQFYLSSENKVDYPHELVINQDIEDKALIAQMISQHAKRQVKIASSQRAAKAQWLQLAIENAMQALTRRIAQGNVVMQRRPTDP